MTREEALRLIKEDTFDLRGYDDKFLIIQDVENILDDIYDDFESRTCESCKYNQEDKCGIRHGIFMMQSYGVQVDLNTFWCNQWEAKDDKGRG